MSRNRIKSNPYIQNIAKIILVITALFALVMFNTYAALIVGISCLILVAVLGGKNFVLKEKLLTLLLALVTCILLIEYSDRYFLYAYIHWFSLLLIATAVHFTYTKNLKRTMGLINIFLIDFVLLYAIFLILTLLIFGFGPT